MTQQFWTAPVWLKMTVAAVAMISVDVSTSGIPPASTSRTILPAPALRLIAGKPTCREELISSRRIRIDEKAEDIGCEGMRWGADVVRAGVGEDDVGCGRVDVGSRIVVG